MPRFDLFPKARHYGFTAPALAALEGAVSLAIERGSGVVGTAHLMLALLPEESEASDEDSPTSQLSPLLLLCGVSREEARLYAEAALETDTDSKRAAPQPDAALRRVLVWALGEARNDGVTPAHLLIALCRPQRAPHVGAVMRPLGLKPGALRAHLRQIERDAAPGGRPLRMLDAQAKAALQAAHAAMRASYCGRISTTHLLIGLADARSPIRTFARAQGVDWAQLRALAAQVQSGDGSVGGPQMQLSPVAKRALERAKSAALKHKQTRIAPEHLLLALLPQRASWREKLRWGGALEDPLESLWSRFDDQALLERALRLYLGRSEPQGKPESGKKADYVRVDWRPVVGAMAWYCWFLLSFEVGLTLLLLTMLVAIVLAIAGATSGARALRDGAASWLYGTVIGLFVFPIVASVLLG